MKRMSTQPTISEIPRRSVLIFLAPAIMERWIWQATYGEWVLDWYAEDYYGSAPRVNPMGPDTGTDKVLKGGSYYDGYEHTRIADRLFHPPIRQASIEDFAVSSQIP